MNKRENLRGPDAARCFSPGKWSPRTARVAKGRRPAGLQQSQRARLPEARTDVRRPSIGDRLPMSMPMPASPVSACQGFDRRFRCPIDGPADSVTSYRAIGVAALADPPMLGLRRCSGDLFIGFPKWLGWSRCPMIMTVYSSLVASINPIACARSAGTIRIAPGKSSLRESAGTQATDTGQGSAERLTLLLMFAELLYRFEVFLRRYRYIRYRPKRTVSATRSVETGRGDSQPGGARIELTFARRPDPTPRLRPTAQQSDRSPPASNTRSRCAPHPCAGPPESGPSF